jgi:hypothetical protein
MRRLMMFGWSNDPLKEDGMTPEQQAILMLFDQVSALRAELDQMKSKGDTSLKVVTGKKGHGRG